MVAVGFSVIYNVISPPASHERCRKRLDVRESGEWSIAFLS